VGAPSRKRLPSVLLMKNGRRAPISPTGEMW
jgi:hypothetical protein